MWPGHGAGSACGKALGAIPSTTVGYEKLANWGVATTDEEEFVNMVLTGQPEPPRYFAQMKRINKEGPAPLGGKPHTPRLQPHLLDALLRTDTIVVDTRPAAEFAAAHGPRPINLPLHDAFTTWAGWLLPYDRDIDLLVDEAQCAHCAERAIRDLAMIGLDRVAGVFGVEALASVPGSNISAATVAQVTTGEAAAMLDAGTATVIDVRGHVEWAAGHLPGSRSIPLGYLADHLADLPSTQPVIVQCQAGSRSAIAASVLQAHGVTSVLNLVGGFVAWERSGLPIETGDSQGTHAVGPALTATAA